MSADEQAEVVIAAPGLPKKARRGFAAMNPEKHRKLASKGGRSVQRQGLGHQWNHREAQAAGFKAAANQRAKKAIAQSGG